MSETLHKILEKYIRIKLSDSDEDEEGKERLVKYFEKEIKEEIVKEEANRIISIKRKELKKQQDDMKKKQLKRKISHAKYFLMTTVIISFLMGVLVNQCTDLISWLKGISPQMPVRYTFIGIILLLIVIFMIFKIVFLDQIMTLLDDL